MPLILNGTTGISGVDGSAGTPSYQGTDTNTGIFYPAADTIAFAEGGAEIARFDSSGNLGIGTPSPGAKLQVNASSGYVEARVSSGTNEVGLAIDGSNAYLAVFDALPLQFQTNNTERMRIESGGDIAIGTTTAVNGARISIAKGSAITTDPFIGGAITMSLQNTSNTVGNSTSIENFDSGGRGNSYIRFINIDQNYAGAIAFGTATTGASNFGERMRISNTGLVSIGASSTVPAGSAALVSLVGSRSAGASCMQQFTYNGGTFGGSLIGSTDQGGGFQIYTFTGNVGSESYSERMRVPSGGGLLVGTTLTSGSTSNGAQIVGGAFRTQSGVNSIPNTGVATTVMTFNNNDGHFLVSMRLSGTGAPSTDDAVALICVNGGSATQTNIKTGSSMVISLSGLNLQATQAIFPGANVSWSVMRISA